MISDVMGKKVFFVYPHSVIQNQLIQDLIDREYEVYFINDHSKVESICEYYTSPILFINIDEGLEEHEWEANIRILLEKESTNHARIGILTYNENAQLAKKYLMDLMVPCGFIKLKLGINESTKIIFKLLEANEVRGKRKYIRAKCSIDDASFNVAYNGTLCNGHIIDISSVGMAVTFDKPLEIPKNTYLKDLQLKLRGILLRVSAVVIGFRQIEGDKTVYVLLFDQYVSNQMKSRLRLFINKSLQHEMEKKLKII
ncbi:MAG: PilZ domain-containing protein [Spirochaetaceae bacterium]|nr:PilZ domain-containing protein [Spirochaetaceae bacterium]